MDTDTRVLLIGGPSHAGKSTVGRILGARPGWTYASTDKLARHPGRPWPQDVIPPHVPEHYLSLNLDELVASVTAHYRGTVWPLAEQLIRTHAEDNGRERLVLEGSALLPISVATLDLPNVRAIWLVADESLLRAHACRERVRDARCAR